MGDSHPLSSAHLATLLIAVIFWGLSFPVIKLALRGIGPLTLGLFRAVFGLLPISIYTFWKNGFSKTLEPLKKQFLPFLAIGLTQYYLPLVTQNLGMTLMAPSTAASMSSILQATAPIFTLIFSALFLKEYIGLKKSIGTVIALTGTVLLVLQGGIRIGRMNVIGNLLLLSSAVFYALSGIFVKKVLYEYEPTQVITLSLIITSFMFVPTSLIFEPAGNILTISQQNWIYALYLGIFCNGVALVLWYGVLTTQQLSKQILFIYMIPLLGVLFSNLFAGEIITRNIVIFGFLIITGITIAQFGKKKRGDDDKGAQ